MPRSGSELVQVLLHQNPKIYASPTSPLLEYQYGARLNYELPEVKSQNNQLMFDAFINMCGSMAQSYYETITDRPIVIDKNRGWIHYYEWVEQWNPNAKMICMIRDIRGILASMERIFRANRHAPVGPDNPAELANMTVLGRINFWLRDKPIGLALERTLNALQTNSAQNILFVKYEDLLQNPQLIMNSIYDYIGEDHFEHDFQNIVKQVEENENFFGVYGNHSIKKELAKYEENSWSDIYNEEVCKAIKEMIPWYFEVFKY